MKKIVSVVVIFLVLIASATQSAVARSNDIQKFQWALSDQALRMALGSQVSNIEQTGIDWASFIESEMNPVRISGSKAYRELFNYPKDWLEDWSKKDGPLPHGNLDADLQET